MLKLTTAKIILVALVVFNVMNAGNHYFDQKGSVKKVSTNDTKLPMTINNIFTYYYNNGDGSKNSISDDGGFEIISSRRGITIFQEGLLWGGYHKGKLKVGGSTYNHALQAGPILTPGTATTAPTFAPVGDAKYRIYRVRPDIGPKTPLDAAMSDKIQNEEVALISKYEVLSVEEVYNAYVKDWNEWPATDGAPYTDVNNNGKYEADTDIPGVPGADQTMWYVANDLDQSRTTHLYGGDPIGIEFQRTIWAYKLAGALGNTIFQKNVLINKSGAAIDSMYVAQWADPDVGGGLGFKDDFTGCDTVLGLGYVYNGTNNDGFFGATPPAMGFDFFQGPIVKGTANDVAKFKGGKRAGYKNLGMTAFNFFINSNALYRDPELNSAAGLQQAYNLLKGTVTTTGAPYTNPKTGQVTKFVLSGDPVTGTGWIDGQISGPDDRRMALCSGPFSMAAGDTQEVVVAAIVGQAYDRLSSVSLLKYYDRLAQKAYDDDFNLPKPPSQPVVSVTELDKEVVLDWSSPASIQAVELPTPKGYTFQGYNVYQLPQNGFLNPKLLATYDIVDAYGTIVDTIYSQSLGALVYVPVQNGKNQGIKRFFNATKDYINDKPFVNGQSYYFAVTAYNLSTAPGASPVSLESSPLVIRVIPQSSKPGNRVNATVETELVAAHKTGIATGSPVVTLINPANITGHAYEIRFSVTDSLGDPGSRVPNTKWSLIDVTNGQTVIAPNTNYSVAGDNPIVHGLQVAMNATPYYVEGSEIAYLGYAKKGQDISKITSMSASNWTGVNGGLGFFGGGFDVAYNFRGSSLTPDKVNQTVEIRFDKTKTQKAYAFLRTTGTGTATYNGFKEQPFTVWDISNPASPRQIDIAFLEQSGNRFQDGVWAPGIASGDREYLYICNDTYTAAEKTEYAGKVETFLATKPMLYGGWITRTDTTKPVYEDGDIFRVTPQVAVTTGDVWTFSTAGLLTFSNDDQKLDVQKANVFPNPYFGFNTKEQTKYNRFVTFNHLPAKATLSILNLAGVRVRTILKDDATQFTTWDLKNEAGLPVASGMYVVYVDMGELGTKILKLAIIQETQQLDKY